MGVFFVFQILSWTSIGFVPTSARVQVVPAETRREYIRVGSGATSMSLTVSADTTCTPT